MNLGENAPAPLSTGTIGCVCRSEAMIASVAAELINKGIPPDAIHVGAADPSRAAAAAQPSGVRADVLSDDPLRGFVALADEAAARRSVDMGGVLGAVGGVVLGIGVSFTPLGAFVPVPHSSQVLANCLLFFVVGTIVGSVLGAAFAPQQSAHVGFRLIDGMQDGGFVLIAVVPRTRLDEVQKVLEASGGTGMTRL